MNLTYLELLKLTTQSHPQSSHFIPAYRPREEPSFQLTTEEQAWWTAVRNADAFRASLDEQE